SFFADIVAVDWFQISQRNGLGSTSVRTKIDFRKPIKRGDPFSISVVLRKLTRSTITYVRRGRNGAGELCFEAELVSCIIDHRKMKSVSIPDHIRQPILDYQAATAAILEGDTTT